MLYHFSQEKEKTLHTINYVFVHTVNDALLSDMFYTNETELKH
jgi:hypothetical protein